MVKKRPHHHSFRVWEYLLAIRILEPNEGSGLEHNLLNLLCFLRRNKIHHQIPVHVITLVDFGRALGASEVLDARRRGVPTRRISNTRQGEAINGNPALRRTQGHEPIEWQRTL